MKKTSILLCSIFLFACSEKVITVDEFKADDALLSQYIAKCKNGELHKEDINCINANKAKNSIILENSKAKNTYNKNTKMLVFFYIKQKIC